MSSLSSTLTRSVSFERRKRRRDRIGLEDVAVSDDASRLISPASRDSIAVVFAVR